MGWNTLDQVNSWLEPGLRGQFVYFAQLLCARWWLRLHKQRTMVNPLAPH